MSANDGHGRQLLASLLAAVALVAGTGAAVLRVVDPAAICAQEDDLCGDDTGKGGGNETGDKGKGGDDGGDKGGENRTAPGFR